MTLSIQVKLVAYILCLINNNLGEIPESEIHCYLSVVGRILRMDSNDFHLDTISSPSNVCGIEVRKIINLERRWRRYLEMRMAFC